MLPYLQCSVPTGLLDPSTHTLRDTYEAFVLYQFLNLCVAYCGGDHQLTHTLAKRKGGHIFPFCCLPTFQLSRQFLTRCERWVMQYALVKPLTTFASICFSIVGLYEEGSFNPTGNAYPFLFLIDNISISFALYFLFLFGKIVRSELKDYRPILKFMAIKSIVFFSFWQSGSVAIAGALGWLDFLNPGLQGSSDEVSSSFSDFLILVEMPLIAILFRAAFSQARMVKECADAEQHNRLHYNDVVLPQRTAAASGATNVFQIFSNLQVCPWLLVSVCAVVSFCVGHHISWRLCC